MNRAITHASTPNPRLYGAPPHTVAVVHGGPGAAGETAPVARELSDEFGVLEPLQTAVTVNGQVEELGAAIAEHGAPPVTVIGFSWGAWLAIMTAARYPERVRGLILVSSGPFEERYTADMGETRLSRLSPAERREAEALFPVIGHGATEEQNAAFARIGSLLSKADAFDALPDHEDEIDCRVDIYAGIWPEAADMRRSGRLLDEARRISCPVLAIHGDYDPHPAEGVRGPLTAVLPDFRFILLARCGHKPWIERDARDVFYSAVREELRAHT